MYILYKYTLTASLFIIQKILFHIIVLLLKQREEQSFIFNFKGMFFFVCSCVPQYAVDAQPEITTAKTRKMFQLFCCSEHVQRV